jgi:hypothetical protein
MCGGVDYRIQPKRYQVYFPQPGARLPVKTRSHGVKQVHWGRRSSEPGHLPVTGWARLESIERGAWARWRPLPVKIMVDSWQEKNKKIGQTFWHALREDEYLQGLLARLRDEERVYIVTVALPRRPASSLWLDTIVFHASCGRWNKDAHYPPRAYLSFLR